MTDERGKFPTPLRGAIVAMTRERVIGVDGGVPWHYGEDLKRFKRRTMGCAVIMGRVTWDSIGRKALPGRRNVVISRSGVPNVECYGGVAQAIKAYPKRKIWVIGGGEIYKEAMPYLDFLDVTFVPKSITRADAIKFPEIDKSCWRKGKKNKVPGEDGLYYVIYRRIVAE